MFHFSPTVCFLRRRHWRRRHSTAVTLERLPVEMLQLIASFLTTDSAASFSLCSKSLQWAIGNQSWFTLRTKDQKGARLSFLISLQRDLREWLLCYHCEKLHLFKLKPDSHTIWKFGRELPCTQADRVTFFLPRFGLRFQYAQMIMKLHKLGAKDTTYLESVYLMLSRPTLNIKFHMVIAPPVLRMTTFS